MNDNLICLWCDIPLYVIVLLLFLLVASRDERINKIQAEHERDMDQINNKLYVVERCLDMKFYKKESGATESRCEPVTDYSGYVSGPVMAGTYKEDRQIDLLQATERLNQEEQ